MHSLVLDDINLSLSDTYARVCARRFVRDAFVPRRTREGRIEPCTKERQWLVHTQFGCLPGARVAAHTAWHSPCHRVARARDEQAAIVPWGSLNTTCLDTNRLTLDHVDDAPLATGGRRRLCARRRRAPSRSVRWLRKGSWIHEGIG